MDKHEGKNLGTATWLQFFKEAGLPTKTCASYAVIFAENRISKDMLSELTVDYLRLMGVTLMGDIIAILRHCKSVHQDSLRKVVILKSKETPSKRTSSSSSSRSRSSSSGKSSSDIIEMVDISKPVGVKTAASSSVRKVENEPKKKSPPLPDVKPIKSKVIGKISSSIIASEKKVAPPTKTKVVVPSKVVEKSVKRKYVEESETVPSAEPIIEMKSLSSNGSKSILKTPVSSAKKIRVVAENDVMMGPKLPPPKKTVFDRLGAESDLSQVSSTTEITKPDVGATTFTRTIRNVVLPISTSSVEVDDVDDDDYDVDDDDYDDNKSPRPKVSSVFDRLGSSKGNSLKTKGPALQYAGVFKSPPTKTTSKPILNILKKVGTMRADEPEIPVKLRAARPKVSLANERPVRVRLEESSVKTRLKLPPRSNERGYVRTKEKEGSAGIFANPYKTSSLTLKDRLGRQNRSEEKYSTISKRIKRNFPATVKMRSDYIGNEDYESKKVSFGRVEQKVITPIRKSTHSRLQADNMVKDRIGVHSRLGTPNFL